MAGETWAYVKPMLRHLECESATTDVKSETVHVVLVMTNRGELTREVRFDTDSTWGLPCGDGVKEMTIEAGRGHGKGCRIRLKSEGGWERTVRVLGALFGDSTMEQIERSKREREIAGISGRLEQARRTLAEVREV